MARMPKEKIPTEQKEQEMLVTWMRLKGIKFYAVPNGGKRSTLEAFKFKRGGVSPGVPDIVVPIPRKSYHGLYIEIKRKSGGRLSDNQQDWISYLRGNGYCAEVAHGFDEAKELLLWYTSLDSTS